MVQSSHKVDILAIESLSKVDECCVEAVVSVSNSVVDVRMQVLSSQEGVSGEGRHVVCSLDGLVGGLITIDSV